MKENFDITAIVWSLLQVKPMVITLIGCLAIGYLFRLFPTFDNQKIPVLVVSSGTIIYIVLCTWPTGLTLWQKVQFGLTNFILGMAVALAVWLLHAQLIKRFEDKIPWLGDALKALDDQPPNPPTAPPPAKP